MKPRVFVLQPIPEVALEIMREVAEVTVYPHLDRTITTDELVERPNGRTTFTFFVTAYSLPK